MNEDNSMRREHLGLHLQRRHPQQSTAMIGLQVDQLLGDGQNLGSSTSLVRPAQSEAKPLPPPPHQRPVYRHSRVPVTPSEPALSTCGSFLSTLGMWRQGFGEWLFPLQSPFSTAGLPAALEAAVTGGSTEKSRVLKLLLTH
jgi:hypothetical protein